MSHRAWEIINPCYSSWTKSKFSKSNCRSLQTYSTENINGHDHGSETLLKSTEVEEQDSISRYQKCKFHEFMTLIRNFWQVFITIRTISHPITTFLDQLEFERSPLTVSASLLPPSMNERSR